MENIIYSIVGILIPFVGTSLGSSFVFFIRKNISQKFQKLIVGFASGVMIAASVWSLLLPSIEMAESQGKISWLPAAVGLSLGVLFLIGINELAKKLEEKSNGKKLNMLLFSVTLHNIPEGMAVGVCFAGFLAGNAGIALLEAIVLAVRNCYTKYTRRSYYFDAIKIGGNEEKKSIFVWGIIWDC